MDATAPELAEALGLHPTTVRFHLRRLVAAGHITEHTEAAQGRGRPRKVYRPAPPSSADTLVFALAGALGTHPTEREERAITAGRLWAADAVQRIAERSDLLESAALERAVAVLTELGFDIHATATLFGEHEIRVCSCPLRSVASRYPDVARGLQCGAVSAALADTTSPGSLDTTKYNVTARPDPRNGDCEVTIRISLDTATETAAQESKEH